MDSIFSTGDPVTFYSATCLFFALLIGHALADFPLQGEYLALFKNRHYVSTEPGKEPEVVWPYVLSAHAIIHMGAVWMITGSFLLSLLEFVLHWVIDFVKCEGLTNYHVDQFLHMGCKALYVVLIALLGPSLF
jgi:hypothetical protein